ncbi:cytochrome P450 [Nemania sp. FL0031]|nr:cytochrome P450 [Nemania sp. FL0031]
MLVELATSLLAAITLAYVIEFARSCSDDPREPRRLRPRIPLVGHILGLLRYGPLYYTLLGAKTDARVYMIDLLNVKMYVANDVSLLPLIMKAHKIISFAPFVKVSAEKIAGNSRSACDLFNGPLLHDYGRSMRMALAPGRPLDEMNMRTGQMSNLAIDNLVKAGKGKRILLLEWARHTVMQASSNGAFGAEHPFRDAKVQKAFWEWQIYLPTHMAGLDLFGRADKAREIVHRSVIDYCATLPPDVSKVVYDRQNVLRSSGMSFEDAAKQESSFCVAIFGNTAPTLFWTIWEIFSRPDLLAAIREEISTNAVAVVTGTYNGIDTSEFTLDVAALKTKCQLLLSSFQEVQRMHDTHANIRKVLADTFLDGGHYLLRKGSYCLVPTSLVHRSTRVWGETPSSFDPYRFMPQNARVYGQGDSKSGITLANSFLGWGTTPHLCPARQFAATEILVLVALLAMRVNLNGQWGKDLGKNTGDLVSIFNPKSDIEVEVKAREAVSGKWTLKMGESTTRIALASG